MFTRKALIWLSILSFVMVLLTLPRFDRNDIFIKSITTDGTGKLSDSEKYVAITNYFRGEVDAKELLPPFSYRPLVPYIASLLPFKAMTAINLINLAVLIIAIFILYKLLHLLGIDFSSSIIACGLFVVSFPTFYYATIGFLDPSLIFLLIIGTYLIFKNKLISLLIVISFGVFVKETIIILPMILAAYLFFNKRLFKKDGLILLLSIIIFTIGFFVTRLIIPANPEVGWMPSIEQLLFNITRPRTFISFILSFGAPGFLSLFIFKYKNSIWLNEKFALTATLITGVIISIALFGFAMLSAYADGRFVWTSYPFTVPLAAMVISEFRNRMIIKLD
ncbi:MAG: hypothetical protein HND52_00205 [Ignavibacteriae bacterium]|nr:hypothetical protein [Ignavibacteriota bacterium]NOG96368.1 hypothetical protein [Ignavibacteriota bacterium]